MLRNQNESAGHGRGRKAARLCILLLAALCALASMSAACAEMTGDTASQPVTYCYTENDGAWKNFTITLNPADSSYCYYETPYSSYIGMGTYTMDGDLLILPDDGSEIVNIFLMEDGRLVFVEDDSTNFTYIKLGDGAEFDLAP